MCFIFGCEINEKKSMSMGEFGQISSPQTQWIQGYFMRQKAPFTKAN